MGYFDALTTSSFKTTEDGRRFFFPYGTIGRGYIIPTEDEYHKLRRAVKIYMMISFFLVILVTRLPLLIGLIVVAILLIPYFLWAHAKSRQMQITQEKLTFKEHELNVTREYSFLGLWLLELGAIGFVFAGIYILIIAPEKWLIASASILFFGLAAIAFGRMIFVKRKLRNVV
jgi:Ca2+/Na+ antiporter